ncbi:MAG: MFS transporter [Bryobacteraceae bacterium]|jgi:ACS family hexuronate transporter-like MFS transporter
MISLAFWATTINYLDRQTLSVAAPVLRDQFHMSNTEYSRVLFAFLLAYTIMNGVSGPLIDRLGTRLGYGLCIAWWSAAALLHAFARGALSLGVFRFLLGIGEAGNWPGGVKVVAEWFPERERALASGIFNSGSAVGAILAPPVVVYIISRLGWPAAFAGIGLTGFVWLVFWWPVYRTPDATAGGGDSAHSARIPVQRLLRSRFVLAFTFSKIFLDPVWYFYIFWFPEYLKRARHFDMASIGAYAWIPFAVAGAGNFAGGLLAEYLLRRGLTVTSARKASVTFFAALMLSAIPAVLTSQAWVSIALVSIAMFGYTGSLANMLSMPADVFPGSAVASVYGLASMGSGFGGMLFTLITGWVVDHYSYRPVFIGFGIMPLICALILWTLAGPLRPAGGKLLFRS